MSNPLVTVNILSFNRKEELRHTLTKVFEQDYKNIEVIVVDNNSHDGTQEMVKAEFPNVKLIELNENIGIAGWNKGFEVAKGKYVLVLDDDSYPDNGTIKAGINTITNDNKIAVVGFNVYNISIKQSQTNIYTSDYIEFIGCGAILSIDIFFEVEGFDDNIFIYAHERDYSVRVLNAGYKIKYLKDAIIFHMPFMSDRKHPLFNEFRIYYSTVSSIVILKKYLKPFSQYQYYKIVLKLLINRLLIALYFNKFNIFTNIFKYIVLDLKEVVVYKNHISKNILFKYDFFNIAIFDSMYLPINSEDNKASKTFDYIRTFFSSTESKIKNIGY